MSCFFAQIVHTGLGLAGAGSFAAGDLSKNACLDYVPLANAEIPHSIVQSRTAFLRYSGVNAVDFGISLWPSRRPFGLDQIPPLWANVPFSHYILHVFKSSRKVCIFTRIKKRIFNLQLTTAMQSSNTEKPGSACDAPGTEHGTTLGAMP